MAAPDEIAGTANDLLSDSLVEVGVYPTFAAGSEHGLVVLAMGLPYWLEPADGGFALRVEANEVEAVREQLMRYARESVGWPPAPVGGGTTYPADRVTPMLWALTVMGVFWATQRFPRWIDLGMLDAKVIFYQGEWWRLVTALFLHGDVGHLVSNTASGIFVFSAISSAFGRARGWGLLLVASISGNLASAAARLPDPYSSIGASTAIFAGLGLLTGRALRHARDSRHPHRWRSMLVPFGAGLTVLALFGAGGQRVDVGAHACGFAAGFGIGLVAAHRRRPIRASS